jgi:diguanylate cyclase (GGDEF)-like protein
LNEELSRSIRYDLPLAIIIARLDNLSADNNDGNQEPKDRLVKETARILRTTLREIDLVGRFGEKEFCIILPSTPMKEAVRVAERIKRTFKKEYIDSDKDASNRKHISMSVGIASFPENGTTSIEMINAAKAALSRAEAEGGNKICCSAV